MTLEYVESRIREVVRLRSPNFWVDAGEVWMADTSVASGEYGKRPDSDPPMMHRGEGGLPNYGQPDAIAARMAAAYRNNHNVLYDPGDLLALGLDLNENKFFKAICGVYNACRNYAAIERGLTDFPDVPVAEKALANIRPPGDPYYSDKAGPVYHFFGIGVVSMGVGSDLARIGTGLQQFAPNTNRVDRFKHHELGVMAVSLFYRLRRENDPVFNALEGVQGAVQPWRYFFN